MADTGRDPGGASRRKQAQQRAIVERQTYASLTGKQDLRHLMLVAAGVMVTQRRLHANQAFY